MVEVFNLLKVVEFYKKWINGSVGDYPKDRDIETEKTVKVSSPQCCTPENTDQRK